MPPKTLAVLRAIAALEPVAYGNAILDHYKNEQAITWFSARFPWWRDLFGMSVYGLHTRLWNLHAEGYVSRAMGQDRPADRGGRRRAYYALTDKGRQKLDIPRAGEG